MGLQQPTRLCLPTAIKDIYEVNPDDLRQVAK
jgi:hypothetical protein